MIPIILASILSGAVILERLFFWLRHFVRRDVSLRRTLCEGQADPRARSGSRDPVVRVLAHMIEMEGNVEAAAERAERELRESKRSVELLNTIGSLSTALGLLGTVVGVALSLRSIALGNAAEIVSGLSIALYTTIGGLIVFLYSTVFAAFFAGLTRGLGEAMEDAIRTFRNRREHSAPAQPAAAP